MSSPTDSNILPEKPIKISGLTLSGTLVLIWIMRGICLLILGITISAIHQRGIHRGYLDNFILCGAIWIPLELWRFSVWCRERWIQRVDTGFALLSHFHYREYEIDDVQKTCLSSRDIQPCFVGGEFHERRLTLSLPDQKVMLQTYFRPDRPDELGPFVEYVTEKRLQRAEETLDAGGSISGHDWTLFSDRLTFLDKGIPSQIKLDDIAAFEIVRNDLLLWKKDDDYPFLRLSLHSENVWLLHRYLSEKSGHANSVSIKDYSEPGLGRFLESFHSSIYTVLFCVLTPAWIYSLFYAFRTIPKTGDACGAAFLFTAIYLLLVVPLGLNGWNANVKIWERGFQCIHWFGTWTGFYENVRNYSMSKSAQYANGFYIGTWRCLTITNRNDETIRFFKNDRSANDGVLGLIHEGLIKVVYLRYLEKLETEGFVQWTDEIRIMPGGIEIKSPGLFAGKKEPVFISYDELQAGQDIDFSGLCLAWGEGAKRTPVKDMLIEPTIAAQLGLREGRVFVPSSIPDFVPGLMLLEYCRINKTS